MRNAGGGPDCVFRAGQRFGRVEGERVFLTPTSSPQIFARVGVNYEIDAFNKIVLGDAVLHPVGEVLSNLEEAVKLAAIHGLHLFIA